MSQLILLNENADCPFDFTWRDCLVCLYALQHYEAMGDRRYKYSPGIFYRQAQNVITGIENKSSRKTILKHLANPVCMVCEVPVGLAGKVLDHIIPSSKGGPDNLENTLVLCKAHNSSKGTRDLLEWWAIKEWPAVDLPRNILCLYTRLMWSHLEILFEDPYDVPDYVKGHITGRAIDLPSDDHRIALYGSVHTSMSIWLSEL